MRSALICIAIPSLRALSVAALLVVTTGCSSSSAKKESATIYPAGEKATIGPLTYSITDTEMTQTLGDDPATARNAQERFYLVKVTVSNSGSSDQPIPAMTLVDDQGHSIAELADGANVPNWLGVVRKVGPTQTEQGVVLFDAPTKHYRLRLNDPFDDKEISIDVPLDFVHEQLNSIKTAPTELPDVTAPKKK
jgi:Domain of unknown function (DUF4352)